jgi:hypothetical protein
MSQFSGCEPTAYERVAFVSYSTFCPGAVVAGVVGVTVAGGTLVVVTVRDATGGAGGVAAGDVTAGWATRVRKPVEAELTAEGRTVCEGWTVPERLAAPQPANIAASNAATATTGASERDRRVEGRTAPRA